jgi:hypothetical protein
MTPQPAAMERLQASMDSVTEPIWFTWEEGKVSRS